MSLFDDPPTVEVTTPPHADMPMCARCRRAVDGIIQYAPHWPFEVQCHGETVLVEPGKDGELPSGLVLFRTEGDQRD